MTNYSTPVVLKIKNVAMHIGEHSLLENASLTVHQGERLGLIGKNGSGKSTLLKMIYGHEEPDKGEIELPNNIMVGYLPQDFELDLNKSVYENILDGATKVLDWLEDYAKPSTNLKHKSELERKILTYDGWNLEKRIDEIITELKIPSKERLAKELSGGEKRRIALARAIIALPDLLILDEPTNHLDTDSIEWIEKFLRSYNGTCIFVTHDRYFLDRTVTRIVELSGGEFHSHNGNYSDFLISKAKRLEVEQQNESKRQSFLRKEYEWVVRGPSGRTSKNKGRLERYYDVADQNKYEQEIEADIVMPPASSFAKRILELNKVGFEVGNKKLFENFDYDFNKGEHIGIVGPNGVGKTTLLKVMIGEIEPTSGRVEIGSQTQINYFDQSKVALNPEKTIFEELGNGGDSVKFGDKSISLRGYLKRFLFSENKINSKIHKLSGGEKSRLLLAKILKNGGNFIILDEPTNDLDLPTLRILEETLINFEGCVVVVSHDRYFLNRVCNRILAMEGDGQIKISEGNYDDYQQRKKSGDWNNSRTNDQSETTNSQVLEPASKLTNDEYNELRKIEKRITNQEKQIAEIESKFNNPDLYTSDNKQLPKLTSELESAKSKLVELYSRWEELESKK